MKLIKTAVDPLSRGVKFKKFGVVSSNPPVEMPWEKKRTALPPPAQPGTQQTGAPTEEGRLPSNSETLVEVGPATLQGQSMARRDRRVTLSLELNQDQWIYYGTAVMTLFLGLVLAFYAYHHGGSKQPNPPSTSGSLTK